MAGALTWVLGFHWESFTEAFQIIPHDTFSNTPPIAIVSTAAWCPSCRTVCTVSWIYSRSVFCCDVYSRAGSLWYFAVYGFGEGNGTQLQYSCLKNPMDGRAWWATVHGVAKSQTQLSDFTFTFHLHALEKEMATHSSVLALRIPGTGEPGGLMSMGLHRVGHDWSNLAAAAAVYEFEQYSQE